MREARIIYRPEARRDALESATYIALENAEAAGRFLEALKTTSEHLAAMPRMGMRQHFKNMALYELRVFPVYGFEKYLIFYHPRSVDIEIVRIIHGARDYPLLLG